MKSAILLIVFLAFLNVQAKKKQGKEEADTKDNMYTGFRLPFFAMRLPLFGSQGIENSVKPSDFVFNDGKHGKLNTKTKSSNSTRGPFKTFTVTTETTSGNKSNPQVFEKVIKSVTTLDKNSKGKNITFPALHTTEFRIFNPFALTRGAKGLNDEPVKECSDKKPCAAEHFCDAFFGVCKKQVAKGGACTQKDQCANKGSGKYQCTWGRCVLNSDAGGAGTFCDAHKDCNENGSNEELGCFSQPDISRFAKICIPKLGEGGTCGKTQMLSIFGDNNDEDSERCRGNFVCRAVGFFGRKVCMKAFSTAEDDHKVVKKSKHKHRKHY